MIHYILDTNALLRYLRNDIPQQADEVAQLFAKAKESTVVATIPVSVFLEAVFALSKVYGEPKESIGSQLFDIASSPVLDIEKRDIVKNALLLWKKEKVSFVDCLILAQVQREGKTLFTFDKRLQKLARRKNTP